MHVLDVLDRGRARLGWVQRRVQLLGAALLYPLREREQWSEQPRLLCPTGRAEEVLEDQLGGDQGDAAVRAAKLLLEPRHYVEQEQPVGGLAVPRRLLLRPAALRGPLPLDLVRPLGAAAALLRGELVRQGATLEPPKRFARAPVAVAVARAFDDKISNVEFGIRWNEGTEQEAARRFPYAVLAGFLFLEKGAAADATGRRRSTFENAHSRLRLFTGRDDPAGRDEQYERLYIVLLDSNPFSPKYDVYAVGDPKSKITLDAAFDELVAVIAERNPDFYEAVGGSLGQDALEAGQRPKGHLAPGAERGVASPAGREMGSAAAFGSPPGPSVVTAACASRGRAHVPPRRCGGRGSR